MQWSCSGAALEISVLEGEVLALSSVDANKPSGIAYFNCTVLRFRAGEQRGCPTFLQGGIWSGIMCWVNIGSGTEAFDSQPREAGAFNISPVKCL